MQFSPGQRWSMWVVAEVKLIRWDHKKEGWSWLTGFPIRGGDGFSLQIETWKSRNYNRWIVRGFVRVDKSICIGFVRVASIGDSNPKLYFDPLFSFDGLVFNLFNNWNPNNGVYTFFLNFRCQDVSSHACTWFNLGWAFIIFGLRTYLMFKG